MAKVCAVELGFLDIVGAQADFSVRTERAPVVTEIEVAGRADVVFDVPSMLVSLTFQISSWRRLTPSAGADIEAGGLILLRHRRGCNEQGGRTDGVHQVLLHIQYLADHGSTEVSSPASFKGCDQTAPFGFTMVERRPQLKWTLLLRISRSVAGMHHRPAWPFPTGVNRLFGFWKLKSTGDGGAARMQQGRTLPGIGRQFTIFGDLSSESKQLSRKSAIGSSLRRRRHAGPADSRRITARGEAVRIR